MRDGLKYVDLESLDLTYKSPWGASPFISTTFTWVEAPARFLKASGENAFFAGTLNSPSAIRACVSFYNFVTLSPLMTSVSLSKSPQYKSVPETRMILYLGSGVNVLPDICYGGLIALILDDVMGLLMSFHERSQTVTARLNIVFRHPLPTPALVLSKAKREKKKTFAEDVIENDTGDIYTEAEALFVEIKETLQI